MGHSPSFDRAVRAATIAVFAAFIGAGFLTASWISRIPQVRDDLDLRPGELGLVLLALAAGSLLGLPLAGLVVGRLGTRRSLTALSLVATGGLATIAIGYRQGHAVVAAGLFAAGLGGGIWDVAMNVEGAAVETLLGRSLMSRFHAGFSVGTVGGAVVGAGLVALEVPVTAHLLASAVLLAVAMPLAARRFLPVDPPAADAAPADGRAAFRRAWRERRTLLIGLSVLTAAFSEGTGNDWIGIAVIDGHDTTAAVGSLGFAVFVAAMTLGRWFGPAVVDRWGRVPALRASGAVALLGLVLFVFGQALPVGIVGIVAWGLGTALGFPVGMSAAADDPQHAAARVSVVASVGYTAFLAGPPVIGLLGDHVGVLRALTVTSGLLATGLVVAGACREPAVPPVASS